MNSSKQILTHVNYGVQCSYNVLYNCICTVQLMYCMFAGAMERLVGGLPEIRWKAPAGATQIFSALRL